VLAGAPLMNSFIHMAQRIQRSNNPSVSERASLFVLTEDLPVSLVLVVLAGSRTPVDEAWSKAREWKIRFEVCAIGMDFK
jgi:hypothetical protein